MLELISQDNYRQLDATFDAFEKLAGRNIEKAIEEEYAGDAKRSLQAMVQCMHDKPKYYAARLYESMKGLGTSDDDLIRLIVSRSEIDLALVRDEFEKQYGKSLIDWIKSECSGAYRDALCLIVRGG
ncbi:hypothetical protein AB6A40_009760 [Gnathostoma spinigerum]|uniref:Annexin n=1 Tax=Gnathostoma spinigerum TaxID=75299 RepID=A0ABD6EZR1_9BILA